MQSGLDGGIAVGAILFVEISSSLGEQQRGFACGRKGEVLLPRLNFLSDFQRFIRPVNKKVHLGKPKPGLEMIGVQLPDAGELLAGLAI